MNEKQPLDRFQPGTEIELESWAPILSLCSADAEGFEPATYASGARTTSANRLVFLWFWGRSHAPLSATRLL